MQELTHHGADGLDLLEAAVRDKVAVVAPDMGVVACGAQGGHVEGDAQVAVAGLGQAWFFVHAGAGVVDLRIETSQSDPLLGLHVRGQDQEFAEELDGAGGGDAGDAGEEVEGLLKVRIGGNQVQDPLAEVLNLGVEVFDVVLESECRRARDAKRDIPVPLSPCARATTCTCRGRPAPGPRLRHFAPPPDPYDEWLDGVSDALASGLRQLRDLRPLRHFGQPLAPTPTADYPPRASRFPGGQRMY